MNGRISLLVALLAAILPFAGMQPVIADDQVFDVSEIAANGRVVTAQFADFSGDGSKDLMLVSLDGIPPNESRTIHVHRQREDGSFPESPDLSVPVPQWSAVFDIADIKDTPGDELVLLRPDGVTILSLADASAASRDWRVEGPSTVAASEDERGFDDDTKGPELDSVEELLEAEDDG